MKLILIRHAKSSWKDPDLPDHERPLKKRGRKAAPLIGRWLAERGHVPALALVSTARRARETWERIAPELPAPVPAVFEPALYHAAPELILAVIRAAPAGDLAVVGHNPGIADLAARLLAEPAEDPDFRRFPTAAAAVIEMPVGSWSEAREASGRLIDFTTPRRLAD
ncbi:MAG: histidine phosphatase family protein [Alphaproteobacteria bacterium]|nr:MAG: histidine phosphatase family protein [Alphaproteobacteria bacterium]